MNRYECPECGWEVCDFSKPGDKKPDRVCMACGWEENLNDDDSQFALALDEIYNLARGAKTNDYGRTWAESGLLGIYIKIMIKEGRLRELIWRNKTPMVQGESIRDTLMDLAAYAVYGILCLDEENYSGQASRKELLEGMLEHIKQELEG